jgi:aromatic-L-amino-acid decarboxylase
MDLDKPIDELLGMSLNMGLRLSNEFLGLKAYILLRAYGADRFGRVIQGNLDQINYLAEKVEEEPLLELSAPVTSNIVCFRYRPKGMSPVQVDELNHHIFQKSMEKTPGIFSDTTIKGRYTLRACNVNHRTRKKDFDWLVTEVKRLGDELTHA